MESEFFVKMVEEKGNSVGLKSDECVLYKVTHKNCNGCEHELGCEKVVALMMTFAASVSYEAKDFKDFLATEKETVRIMKKILKAKTHDEIRKLLL